MAINMLEYTLLNRYLKIHSYNLSHQQPFEEKSHIISIEMAKAIDQVQPPFMIKLSAGIVKNFITCRRNIYLKNPPGNITPNNEKLIHTFPLDWSKAKVFLLTTLFHIVLFASSIQYPVPRLLTRLVSSTLRAQLNCRLFRETATNTILPTYLVTCFFLLEYAV